MNRVSGIRIVLLLAIAIFLVFNLQNTMLYYPTDTIPSQAQLEADRIRFWPSGQDTYRGFVSTSPLTGVKGTVVIFHGNAGNAADRAYYVEALAPLGYRVVLAEYPGYGSRKGRPGEAAFRNDARETLQMVMKEFGQPIYLLGESLGCAVAAAVAKNSPVETRALILITPWDTLLAVAKDKFPWLPVGLLLRDSYDTVANLKTFSGRIAVIAAERDEIIPVRHAWSLYNSLPGAKRIWTIRGAGHNDWPLIADRSLWKEIMDFADR